MAKHNKKEVDILGGKAKIYINDYGVWQIRLWLTTDNKYVRNSLRTKVNINLTIIAKIIFFKLWMFLTKRKEVILCQILLLRIQKLKYL